MFCQAGLVPEASSASGAAAGSSGGAAAPGASKERTGSCGASGVPATAPASGVISNASTAAEMVEVQGMDAAEACLGLSPAEEAAGHESPQSQATSDLAAELAPPLHAHRMPAGETVSQPLPLVDFACHCIPVKGRTASSQHLHSSTRCSVAAAHKFIKRNCIHAAGEQLACTDGGDAPVVDDGVSREEHVAMQEDHAAVRGQHTVLSPEQAVLRATVVQLESAVQAALAEADRARALAQQVPP